MWLFWTNKCSWAHVHLKAGSSNINVVTRIFWGNKCMFTWWPTVGEWIAGACSRLWSYTCSTPHLQKIWNWEHILTNWWVRVKPSKSWLQALGESINGAWWTTRWRLLKGEGINSVLTPQKVIQEQEWYHRLLAFQVRQWGPCPG